MFQVAVTWGVKEILRNTLSFTVQRFEGVPELDLIPYIPAIERTTEFDRLLYGYQRHIWQNVNVP